MRFIDLIKHTVRYKKMSISYEYHANNGYIHTKVTDNITLQEVLSYVESILEDTRIDKPFYELVDFSETKNFDFGYYQTDQLYDKLVLLKKNKKHLGTCFIPSITVTIGMSNIFKVVGEDKGMNIQIFSNLDEALEYIKNA